MPSQEPGDLALLSSDQLLIAFRKLLLGQVSLHKQRHTQKGGQLLALFCLLCPRWKG